MDLRFFAALMRQSAKQHLTHLLPIADPMKDDNNLTWQIPLTKQEWLTLVYSARLISRQAEDSIGFDHVSTALMPVANNAKGLS